MLSFNDFNQSYFLIILKHEPNSVNIQIILMAAFSHMQLYGNIDWLDILPRTKCKELSINCVNNYFWVIFLLLPFSRLSA